MIEDKKKITYTRAGDDIKGLNVACFTDGKGVVNGSSWGLNAFLEKHEAERVIFIQGDEPKHDVFHVWYKTSV